MSLRALAMAAMCASCSSLPARPVERLSGTDGARHEIGPRASNDFTVLIFFSADCQVLKAHDERVRRLASEYAGRGVQFFGVDPEVGATVERDRAEAERRRYPFPILIDDGARAAKMFGAEYAGHAVVLDREGRVSYRGGIDSDRVHLTGGATPYLNDALADLVSGRPVERPDAKTLGCALRTW